MILIATTAPCLTAAGNTGNQPQTTIWTALMLVEDKHGDRMCLCDSTHQNGSWLADYPRSETIAAFTQGEAVCACFVAADPLGHLGRAGV